MPAHAGHWISYRDGCLEGRVVMRLSSEQQQQITEAARLCYGEQARVYLFGSRVDDNSHGGDIDLYIEIDDQPDWFMRKLQLASLLQERLGERRIDLLIYRHGEPRSAIQDIAKSTGVCL